MVVAVGGSLSASGSGGGGVGSGNSAGVPGLLSKDSANNIMDLDNRDMDEDKISNNNYDNDNDQAPPVEVEMPLENANARKVCLLCGVVNTNEDYGLGELVRLPDARADALAMFDDVELQALTCFALCWVVCEGGFSETDPPICARCLQ